MSRDHTTADTTADTTDTTADTTETNTAASARARANADASADARTETARDGNAPGEGSTAGAAVLVGRARDEHPDLTELRGLAETAGHDVVAELTQRRREDPGTYLGDGKVDELATLVADRDAEAVVVDGDLSPGQTVAIEDRLPDGTAVLDRYRLVLSVFADRTGTERARLQVELARLRYELPRLRERTGDHVLTRALEKGSPVYDVEDRIADLRRRLEELPSPADRARRRRREQGFDLVALAGYTNAGKSTLLHRLADDLSVASIEPDHPDETGTATVADRLFETLSTTTRRATVGGRRTLVTDTVGFVDGLAHDLVASFSTTLAEVRAADVAVLVVDATDPADRLVENVDTTLGVVDVDPRTTVVALNKVDLVEAATVDRLRSLVADRLATPDAGEDGADRDDGTDGEADPADGSAGPAVVPVSAVRGTGVDRLRAAIGERLPTTSAELTVPAGDEAMRLVSRAHDRCSTVDVTYGDPVRIELTGRPAVVERLRSRARAVDRSTTGS